MGDEQTVPGDAEARLAANMRRRREEMGLSQEGFAEKVSSHGFAWNRTTVYNVENGQRRVRLNEAEALAGILGVRLDELIGSQFAVTDAANAVWAEEARIETAVERMLTAQDRLRRELQAIGGVDALQGKLRADVQESLDVTPEMAVQHFRELEAIVNRRDHGLDR